MVEIWAPATGLLARGPHLPPGPEELGLIELTLDSGSVEARFMTVPGLIEQGPQDIPQVKAAIDELAGRMDGDGASDPLCG